MLFLFRMGTKGHIPVALARYWKLLVNRESQVITSMLLSFTEIIFVVRLHLPQSVVSQVETLDRGISMVIFDYGDGKKTLNLGLFFILPRVRFVGDATLHFGRDCQKGQITSSPTYWKHTRISLTPSS